MLTLKSGVDVYGGFEGTEVAVSQRSTPTSDSATTLNASGQAFPVVMGATDVSFDGFRIMNATGTEGPAFRAERCL